MEIPLVRLEGWWCFNAWGLNSPKTLSLTHLVVDGVVGRELCRGCQLQHLQRVSPCDLSSSQPSGWVQSKHLKKNQEEACVHFMT